MTALDNHLTDEELAKELKKKTGFGCERTLRKWRDQRVGPPWIKFGRSILYPIDGFESRGSLHRVGVRSAAGCWLTLGNRH